MFTVRSEIQKEMLFTGRKGSKVVKMRTEREINKG